MADAVTVAEDILTLAKRRGVSLEAMQLFLLSYLAYGWYLEFEGKKLFDEPFQAWNIGPVVPSIFNEFSKYGTDPIPDERVPEAVQIESLEPFLDSVLEAYGGMTRSSFARLTTDEGTPWRRIYKPKDIPVTSIARHFHDLARRSEEQLEIGEVAHA